MRPKNGLSALGFLLGSVFSLAGAAFGETPESPAEIAQTVQLNRDIAAQNAAADARYQAAKMKYDEDKRQNDAQAAQYQDQVKQNAVLQEQYQEKLKDYQKAHPSKPDAQ